MADSILTSVKRNIGGIDASDTTFDSELIDEINTAFAFLFRLSGIGVDSAPYKITETGGETWDDFTSSTGSPSGVQTLCNQYVSLRTKQLFDKTESATYNDAISRLVSELDFSISIEVDPGD